MARQSGQFESQQVDPLGEGVELAAQGGLERLAFSLEFAQAFRSGGLVLVVLGAGDRLVPVVPAEELPDVVDQNRDHAEKRDGAHEVHEHPVGYEAFHVSASHADRRGPAGPAPARSGGIRDQRCVAPTSTVNSVEVPLTATAARPMAFWIWLNRSEPVAVVS